MTRDYNAIVENEEALSFNAEANDLNKIHFYLDLVDNEKAFSTKTVVDSDKNTYLYIKDTSELNEAIKIMRDSQDSESKIGETILITVEFNSDYFETKEYIEFTKQLNLTKSIKEMQSLRKDLNYLIKTRHFILMMMV